MVTCPTCNTIKVIVNNGNFARTKPEGAPSVKHTYDIRFFYCEKCEQHWESNPESQRDYYDYLALRDRTEFSFGDISRDGKYSTPKQINVGELMLRTELAKKISTSYRHVLDLPPGEWHAITLDAGPIDDN